VSQQPNKWEHDTDSHGTHVTSTILGYSLRGTPIAGTAPKATVIPVKVLDQTGSGWSSVIAAGIRYVAELKAGPLADDPVVINMSLGGPYVDAVEQAAIDYAITKGVIVVAAAGNYGARGMAFPGSYEPVISVASAGWIHEWTDCGPGERAWWLACDISDPTPADEFYVPGYSSRAKPGQELDVTAPGELVVGPYQLQSGRIEYWFLGGTSMAAPHVAGVVALMAEKHPGLTAAEAEGILEGTALALVGYDAKDQGAGLIQADLALAATP
jgi:subtilisin family serine protease